MPLTSASNFQLNASSHVSELQTFHLSWKFDHMADMAMIDNLERQAESRETIYSFHFTTESNPLDQGWILSRECYESKEIYYDTKDFRQAMNGKFVKRVENGVIIEKIVSQSKGLIYRKRKVYDYEQDDVVPFKILIQCQDYQKNNVELLEIVAEYPNGDRHHFYQLQAGSLKELEFKIKLIRFFEPQSCRSTIMEGIYRYSNLVLYKSIANICEIRNAEYASCGTGLNKKERHTNSHFYKKSVSDIDFIIMCLRIDGEIPDKYPDPLLNFKQFLTTFKKISEQETKNYNEYSDNSAF
eukprot:NODE_137_length_16306_cov_0.462640.p5 type:complete len:298 gc:universal NODE_137_length_16306_cov_0.462640:6998-7891(+)